MPAVGQVFAEDLSEVFVDANIHMYLPPAARESLPRPLPSLALKVYTTLSYGTPGNVRLEHPQEIAGFYIQAAGEKVAQTTHVRAEGCEQCDAAYGEEGSRQIPFFIVCRSFGNVQGGACASCVMKHRAANCSLHSSREDREPTPPPKDDTPRPGERAGTRAYAQKLALEEAQRNGGGNVV
ncbi:hypothetical protein VE00_04338 [Pseudogymnoascus sp. WSF 3629]|nr:hypothetical protein VE00_04338 [Pseudogymnoascus sp. WSF 3629]